MRRPTEVNEFREIVERWEYFERQFVAQLRDDLLVAAARQALGRTDVVAARLTQAVVAAQQLSEAVEAPVRGDGDRTLRAIRHHHREMIRALSFLAIGSLALIVLTLAFVVSQ